MEEFGQAVALLLLLLSIIFIPLTILSVVRSSAILWKSEEWVCTSTRYPNPDKKEAFAPYCIQWSLPTK